MNEDFSWQQTILLCTFFVCIAAVVIVLILH